MCTVYPRTSSSIPQTRSSSAMTFLEKLFYFTISTCGFAVALIIHYYLVKRSPTPTSSTSTAEKRLDSTSIEPTSSAALLTAASVRRKTMSYKPRGVLARTVYEKVHNDQYLDGYDMKLVIFTQYLITPIRYSDYNRF